MLRFIVRLLVNSLALAVAVWIVPGLTMVAYAEGEPVISGGPSLELIVSYVFIAFVFGLINGIVGNAIRMVAFPLYLLTIQPPQRGEQVHAHTQRLQGVRGCDVLLYPPNGLVRPLMKGRLEVERPKAHPW